MQRISDPVLDLCPACGAREFAKQVTAAGFQLKGSGWYATDFRGGNVPAPADQTEKSEKGGKAEKTAKTPGGATAAPAAAESPTASPAAAPAADKPRSPPSEAA